MNCPVCNYKDSKVVDSRASSDNMAIRRRRECAKCEFRFSTLEEVELLDLTVVKRDGRRAAYSRDKLSRGVAKSLEKRPFTEQGFVNLIHKIERDIHKKAKRGEVTSDKLGEMVMTRLKTFDKVAYIRFASVYRSFEDVESFQKELKKLTLGKGKKKKK